MNGLEQARAILAEANKGKRNNGATKLDAIYNILKEAEEPMSKNEIVEIAAFNAIEAKYGEELDLVENEEQRQELIQIAAKLDKTVGTAVSRSNNSASISYNDKYEELVFSIKTPKGTKYELRMPTEEELEAYLAKKDA